MNQDQKVIKRLNLEHSSSSALLLDDILIEEIPVAKFAKFGMATVNRPGRQKRHYSSSNARFGQRSTISRCLYSAVCSARI
jgi:hypothetical protein